MVLDPPGEDEVQDVSDRGEPIFQDLSGALVIPSNTRIGRGQKGHKRSPAISGPALAFRLKEV
jgi:hypothetical protein